MLWRLEDAVRRALLPVMLGVLVIGLVGIDVGAEVTIVPQSYLETITDDDPNPLPRGLAPGESVPILDVLKELRTPPDGTVQTPAEYEVNDGLLIRWGSFNSLLTAITVAVTTGTDATVWVVVWSASQQSSAESILLGAGADMTQVDFILFDTDTVWIRDYGPRFIDEDGDRAIVDHTYNRPRPNDNELPDHLAGLWNEAQYDIPLVHGGGNFHLFSDGEAFMSELILNENPGLSAQDVEDYYEQYQGLDLTILAPLPSWYDSTQHIDMWMLPVARREVVIGEYDPGDSQAHAVTEEAVTLLQSRGYTVHRTPGWRSGGTHYTYTNSVILNDIVLTCQFENASPQYADEDAEALATFEAAFPGRTIVPVDCSTIIDYSGAIHCIVMHVPEVSAVVFSDGFESGDLSAWD